MRIKYLLLSLLVIFALSSCSDDNDNPPIDNVNELSIEPYFKYIGLSLDDIRHEFSTSLLDNTKSFYYVKSIWVYNHVFDVRFYVSDTTHCTKVQLKGQDNKTTSFDHYKLFTLEAFQNLGEPSSAAVYFYTDPLNSIYETLFQVSPPLKKGGYEEAIQFSEKNNISKIDHACEMIWHKNNYKIRYLFSTILSEVNPFFYIEITE